VLHRLGVIGPLTGWRQVPQRLGVAGPVGKLDQDGVVRGTAKPAQVFLFDGGPVLARPGLGDRHPADQFGHPRPESGADLFERAAGVLHHVVQDHCAQDLRVGHSRAAYEHLQRFQGVLHVRCAAWPPLVTVVSGGEVHRLVQPGHGTRGQPFAQPRFRLLPGVPVREELHVIRW
jgi:hypothetical protein